MGKIKKATKMAAFSLKFECGKRESNPHTRKGVRL